MTTNSAESTGAQGLLSLICSGLELHAQQETAAQLGDRTHYVGMSDIATMYDCPRAAVLRKCVANAW